MNDILEKYRESRGFWQSKTGDNFGLFFIPNKPGQPKLKVLCSPLGEGDWDHVSVSLPNRTPTWSEMCKVKKLFWGEDVTVIQFHPKKSEYIDNHKFCLHLWKSNTSVHELPPSILVGVKKES